MKLGTKSQARGEGATGASRTLHSAQGPSRPSSPSSTPSGRSRTFGRRLALVPMIFIAVFMYLSGVAMAAATPAPGLTIHTVAPLQGFSQAKNIACEAVLTGRPCVSYAVNVTNSGSVSSEGPVVLEEHLPAGFSIVKFELLLAPAVPNGALQNVSRIIENGACEPQGEPVTVTCTFGGTLAPDESLELRMFVQVAPGIPTGELNTATVTGPGSPEASMTEPLAVDSAASVFGPSDLVSYVAGLDGAPDTQAGDHPYEMTTHFDLNTDLRAEPEGPIGQTSVQDVKDVIVDLPPGLLGNAQATPKCAFSQLTSVAGCPPETRVGQIVTEPESGPSSFIGLFNMVPEHGVAAEFGFFDALKSTHAIYATLAPTPAGYVVRAVTKEVPQIPLTNVTATFFGTPAAKDGTETTPVSMFTNPSDCAAGPLVSTIHLDSWQQPGPFALNGTPAGEPEVFGPNWVSAASDESPAGQTVTPATTSAVTGCNQLRFNPSSFTVLPDIATGGSSSGGGSTPPSISADSPTGLNFDLQIKQSEKLGQLATPPLKNTSVTLPAGMTLDPSAANGLSACTANPADAPGSAGNQIGWLGPKGPKGEELANHGYTNFSAAAPACPDSSNVGSVKVETPLLEHPVEGAIFLASQYENPYGSLLGGYIVINDPNTGIIVKIPGKIEANPVTGQLTGVFDDAPQVAVFEDLKIHFTGGVHGDLATPQACGNYTTQSNMEPWSAPDSGPNATPTSSFAVNANCPTGALNPTFSAGTESNQAAGYSPFTLTLARTDADQHISGLSVTMPPGLLGVLSSVEQCPEPQAARGTCGPNSLIGETTVAAGVGPNPFVVHGGKVFLTGPYGGGPFGLSVVVPAVAGPFNLGNVVVRSSIQVNPTTSQITVNTYPIPQMINSIEGLQSGVPADVKTIYVTINRKNFIFNPTNCSPLSVTGSVSGALGANTPISAPYEASNCQGLKFAPVFSASTNGKTSKQNGASLRVKIAYPYTGGANVAKVELEIPKALPSRLTTLQKACTEAQFNSNPAGCPSASDIATAIVQTPLLSHPLEGPAYFVSHGNAAFPDVEIVLQGEGITFVLDGHTQIKNGITYSRFESAPDAPFSSFEFYAPEGPFSIFSANGNLCAETKTTTVKKTVTKRVHGKKKKVTVNVTKRTPETIVIPTKITGQNGAVLKQSTKVQVTGCSTAKASKASIARKKAKNARRASAHATRRTGR